MSRPAADPSRAAAPRSGPGPAARLILGLAALFALGAPPARAMTLEEAVALALSNNPRIREFSRLAEAQGERVGSSKGAFWPSLDLYYGATRQEKDLFLPTETYSVAQAEGSYNLFRGFSDAGNLEAERARLDAALSRKAGTEQDVILEAKRAYIEILRGRDRVAVQREALELLERQRRDAELFFREGLTAKNEFLRVEVDLASARQDLLRAESLFRVAVSALERTVGVPVGDGTPFEGLAPLPAWEPDEGALGAEMLERRSELVSLRALREAAVAGERAVRGRNYPSVDLSVIYGTRGDSAAPDGLPAGPDTELRGTLEARWNLFEGFRTRHDARAAAAEARAIEERIRDAEADLGNQLRNAVEAYRLTAKEIPIAELAVEQAKENYRITERQYKERVAPISDLIDARVFLTRARTEHNNATYNLRQALAVLERVVEHPLPPAPAPTSPAGSSPDRR